MNKLLFFLCILCSSFCLFSQQDTSILKQDLLIRIDSSKTDRETSGQRIISTFSETKSIQNSPYTAYIVTKEEIRDNGYVTLIDVLNQVPGVFTSSYGSASEGELFMMRGMRGNSRAKILINGISVKPMLTRGMPLGGQMPIRQAERIEIIQGTSSSEFGFDASAGIINIVLKESNRPVYAQADLSIGDLGYTNVDVMFGGKIGRGKNLLRFSAWGSSTLANDWRVPFPVDTTDTELMQVYGNSNYVNNYGREDLFYLSAENYRGSRKLANRNAFSHQSRQFGLRFQYKKLDFGLDYHSRRDHAALGLNPLALGYHNSNSFKGEQFPRITFSRKPGNKKLTYSLKVSAMLYYMDGRSSQQPIQNYYSFELEERVLGLLRDSGIEITPIILDSVRTTIYEERLDGEKYDFGYHYQVTNQHIFSAKIWQKHRLIFGGSLDFATGVPETNYLNNPIGENFTLFNTQFLGEQGRAINPGLFFQTDFNWDKYSLSFGARIFSAYLAPDFYERNASIRYSPRTNFTLRGSIGLKQWVPNSYFGWQNYFFRGNARVPPNRMNIIFESERTTSLELGFRWQNKDKNYFDFTYFVNNTNNLFRYGFWDNLEGKTFYSTAAGAGYINVPNTYRRLTGFQGQIEMLDLANIEGLKLKLGGLLHFGVYNPTGEEGDEINEIEDFPNLLTQGSLSYNLGTDWYFNFENVFHSFVPSPYVQNVEPGPGGLISNLLVRYKFSDNFGIYVKGMNIFNTITTGISANETPDALNYNLQPLFRVRLGANYRLE